MIEFPDRPEEIISNADLIISTVPSHIFPGNHGKDKSIYQTRDLAWSEPGSGGCEFICQDLLAKEDVSYFGFQRVYVLPGSKNMENPFMIWGKKKLFIWLRFLVIRPKTYVLFWVTC